VETSAHVFVEAGLRGFLFENERAPVVAAVTQELQRALGPGRVSQGTEGLSGPTLHEAVIARVSTVCSPAVPPCMLTVTFTRQGAPLSGPWPLAIAASLDAPGSVEQFVAATHALQPADPPASPTEVATEGTPPAFRLLGGDTQRHGWVAQLMPRLTAQLASSRTCFPDAADMTFPVLLALGGDGAVDHAVIDDVNEESRQCFARHLKRVRLVAVHGADRVWFQVAMHPVRVTSAAQ
jgi:hypothetical protein